MGNIGKDVTELLSHQEISKAWEKKPKSYIIFKDLLKSIFLFFPLFEFALSEGSRKRGIVLLLRIVFGVSGRRMAAYLFFFFFGACRVGVGRYQRINQKIRK